MSQLMPQQQQNTPVVRHEQKLVPDGTHVLHACAWPNELCKTASVLMTTSIYLGR